MPFYLWFMVLKIHSSQEYEFYKEWYNEENDRCYKLYSRITLLFSIISLLLVAILFVIKKTLLSNINMTIFSWIIFYLFFLGCIIATIIAIILFFKTFYDYEYSFYPELNIIDTYFNQLETHYEKEYYNGLNAEQKEKKIKQDRNDVICKIRKECIKTNRLANDNRSKLIHYTYTFIIISIVFLFLSALPYFINATLNNNKKKAMNSSRYIILKIKEIDNNDY